MNKFAGFSDSDSFTAIPDAFFNVLLKDIQDDELRVILYTLWRVERMEGTYRAVSEAEIESDSLGLEPERAKSGLEKAVERGVLLRAAHDGKVLYFVNSPRGQAGAQTFALRGYDGATATSSLPLERPNIFKVYEENIGPLTPIIADELKGAEAQYAPEWIAEAIALAVENNKRSWKYCEAILRRWKEEGRAQKQNRRDDQTARRRNAKDKIRRFLEG